ncbi:hypothetical protein [Membranihabitans marinus]|uniref:hypothetical protein n=1 Tax=Membranihabitans marinus TaxID=1227546 RepID=UPI001F455DB5|nr:hypothetical protein [Membranihabitans marinus]
MKKRIIQILAFFVLMAFMYFLSYSSSHTDATKSGEKVVHVLSSAGAAFVMVYLTEWMGVYKVRK